MSIILNPIEQFFDIDGTPLEQGYIYLGSVNGNPETSPIQVYWDALFTIPASQPIRTINGYPARNGSPASIYSVSDVSLQVRNKQKSSVFYTPTSSVSSASSNISNRTSNILLNQGDNGKVIVANGTFTQTFDASVALGNGWTITYVNIGPGVITLDPNLSELIDGISSIQLLPHTSCIISCDGIGLNTTLAKAFPIGSVYISTVSTNPATLLGYGTWVAYGTGRALVAIDPANPIMDTVGETFGVADTVVPAHTHNVFEPSHTHDYNHGNGNAAGSSASGYGGGTLGLYATSAAVTGISVLSAGVSPTNKNYQPSIAVYIWNRTA